MAATISTLPALTDAAADGDEFAMSDFSEANPLQKDKRLSITKLRADAFLGRANTWTAAQTVQSPAAGTVPLTVQGAASQTASIQEWSGSSGTTLVAVSGSGELSVTSNQDNNGNVAVRRAFNIGGFSSAATWTVDISNLQASTSYGVFCRFSGPSSTGSQVAIREWHCGARTASGAVVTAYYPGSPTVSVGNGTFDFAVSSPSAGVLRLTITNNSGGNRNYCAALVEVQWGYTSVTASNRPVIST